MQRTTRKAPLRRPTSRRASVPPARWGLGCAPALALSGVAGPALRGSTPAPTVLEEHESSGMPRGVYVKTPEMRANLSASLLGRTLAPATLARVQAVNRARLCLPIGSLRLKQKYLLIKVAQPDVWEWQHRVVMGLRPKDSRVVHHIDGDRRNNVPSNLQIMTASEHSSHHNNHNEHRVLFYGMRDCAFCGAEFEMHQNWHRFCRPICRKRSKYGNKNTSRLG